MKTPPPPTTTKIVDSEGNMNDSWVRWFSMMQSQFEYHFPDDGFVHPTVNTAQIQEMEKPFMDQENKIKNPKYKQTKIVYNEDTKKFMLNEDGVFKTITTS